MSHPKNRRERFLKGYFYGLRRIKYYASPSDLIRDPEWVVSFTRRLRQTGKPCSCTMCGNPRKWRKEQTMQERRNDEKYWKEKSDL